MATTRTQYRNSPGANTFYTVVTTDASYVCVASDRYININSGSAHALTLVSNPNAGDTIIVRDTSGSAATNNITITPAAGNIDGAASFVIKVNKASVTLVYSGTEWNILNRKSSVINIQLFTSVASESLGSWTRISNYYWDPAALNLPAVPVYKLYGVIESSDNAAFCEVRLYNLTDASVITNAEMSDNLTVPQPTITIAFSMPTTAKLIEVQMRTDNNAYTATCSNVGIRISE